MAIETITQEENFARMQGKEVPMPDDGPTFAMLAFILSIAMWAYEGGWVAAVLSKGWTGFPTLLTVIQLVVGITMMVPIVFSMLTMIVITYSWIKTDRLLTSRAS
ncbi:hypothetical protein AAMO2058_000728000 [Amorphochlora amoebiformis]